MKFDCFLDVFNSTLNLKIEKTCIMKIKGPFVKVVLLNEVVKHSLFKSNLDIGRFCDQFTFFQYPYYSIKKLSMINIPLKWHHIGICNKNCRKVDMLIRILACFHSSELICVKL